MSQKPNPARYVSDAWLVLLLSLVSGGLLAGVHAELSDRIAGNKLAETLSQIPMLVPGAATEGAEPVTIGERTVYRVAGDDGGLLGWVVPAGGQGFADRIELLIGLDATASTLTGLYVLDQKETPGLGNRIVEDEWRSQFTGLGAAPLAVTKSSPGENEIQAVTGATISSESICSIVNEALAEVAPSLAEESGR